MEPIETPVQKAARILGGAAALSAACGVSMQAAYQWINGSRPVPAERAPLIERATADVGDIVMADELCPKVRWDLIRDSNNPPVAA